MRTFYIFKIKNEYAILTKNNPYHLYKMLSYIYNLDTSELQRGADLFYKLVERLNKKELDSKIFKNNQDNYFYSKVKDTHQINNYYKKEESKLMIHNHFFTLTSSVVHSSFFDELTGLENLFVCDFENIDYFWLEKIAT